MRVSNTGHKNPPETQPLGDFLFRFVAGGLGLRLATDYIISVQPFTDVIGDYTATTEITKDERISKLEHPLPLPVWGW